MSYSPYSPHTDLSHTALRCPYSQCHARILTPKSSATLSIHTGITFLKVDETQPSTHDDTFLRVEDVWDFDNIGVSKTFDHPHGDVKLERLIICSECERGPLGFAAFDEGSSDVKDLKYYVHLPSFVYGS